MKRKIIALLSISMLFILLVACSNDNEQDASKDDKASGENEETIDKANKDKKGNKEKPDLGDYNVSFSGDIVEEDDKFIINGQSNLIPGSRVDGAVLVNSGADSFDDEKEVFSDTTELVGDDGSFTMELEHHQYGEAEIIVKFDFSSVQEDEVKRHYGDKGQKLEGPFIYKHKEFGDVLQKAEARIEYSPNESNNLVIKPQDWYELPSDYGDPRVWIEIEEVTEDGEYFYIHGKSNILEGSEIRADYGFNDDKTQVNPDGSFDFKIDYEYLEEEEFVIEFKPSSFQWNEIEEAYGKEGQKLVGDLVVTNSPNTYQYIEKRFSLDEFQVGKNENGKGNHDERQSDNAETNDATDDQDEGKNESELEGEENEEDNEEDNE